MARGGNREEGDNKEEGDKKPRVIGAPNDGIRTAAVPSYFYNSLVE
jgi:hypothetical protein